MTKSNFFDFSLILANHTAHIGDLSQNSEPGVHGINAEVSN